MYLVVKLFTIDRRHFCFEEALFSAGPTWKNSAFDSAGKQENRNATEQGLLLCGLDKKIGCNLNREIYASSAVLFV